MMMEQQKKAIVFPLRNAGEYIEKENDMARAKIDFTKMDNIKFIEEVAEGISKEDKNWDWQAKEICQHSLLLWWEYLRFEGTEGFKIEYDEDEDFFSVYDEQGDDITDELEDTLDMKSTMRSIFWYASSRY